MGKRITREFVAKKAWAEFLNKNNSSVTRQRYMFLACHLLNFIKLAPVMPTNPKGEGGRESPELEAFDLMMKEIDRVRRKKDERISEGRPERCEKVRTSVGLERDQDDSGLDFTPVRD